MKLWTVWLDYFATGEGRSLMARIAYAETAERAREGFEARFGDYFAQGASVAEGVVCNGVTERLFAPSALEHLQSLSGQAALTLEGYYFFNRG